MNFLFIRRQLLLLFVMFVVVVENDICAFDLRYFCAVFYNRVQNKATVVFFAFSTLHFQQ